MRRDVHDDVYPLFFSNQWIVAAILSKRIAQHVKKHVP